MAIKSDGAKVRVFKDMVAHIPKIWAAPSVPHSLVKEYKRRGRKPKNLGKPR